MKVLIVLPSFENAGPIKVALMSCISLAKLNVRVDVFSYNSKGGYCEKFINEADNVHVAEGFIKGYIALKSLVNVNNYDVIHSHGLKPDLSSYLLSLTSTTMHFSTLHCDLFAYYKTDFGRFGGLTRWLLHLQTLRRLDHVFNVSASVGEINRLKNSSVLYNAVENQEMMAKKNGRRTLIYLGRVSKEKNLAFLIHALAQYSGDIRLKVIGDGDCLDSIKKLAKSKNVQVSFTGFLQNYMVELDYDCIFINPSLTEGMPMAALEMMSCGIPLLLSNIPAHKELDNILSEPEYLKLFDFKYDSFNKALDDLLCSDDNKRNHIQSIFNSKFSVNSYGVRLVCAYSKLIAENTK